MYFWRIEKLKTQMAARPLSERETLPYLVGFTALSSAMLPQTTHNLWDSLGTVWSVLLAVVGTIYIFRQNGGAGGQYFLQRYFVIGWVVGIRWFVIIMLVAIAFYITLMVMGADTESTNWYDFILFAVAEVVVYWRVGSHVRDLAKMARAA